ncbi:subtilisin-like protein [Fistulina hepatica ATCC 64428]|nr:subtilisin-like protein [Fistulina hepatica ATCC 64428]
MLSRTVLPLILFFTAVLALPVLHEHRYHIPAGWKRTRRSTGDAVLPLRFGLHQSNLHLLDEFLHDVAHPESPNYGKHWGPKDVADTFAPSPESVTAVVEWLLQSGFLREHIGVANGWVQVNASVTDAEALLGTEYAVYEHDSGAKHIGNEGYHLPANVSQHVDLVLPSVHFDARIDRRARDIDTTHYTNNVGKPGFGMKPKTTGVIDECYPPEDLSHCDTQTTPACLRALYNVDNYTPRAAHKNSYGIVEYTPQAYLQTDLDLFAKNFSTDLLGRSPNILSIDGGFVQTDYQLFDFNGESNLDLQYGMSLVTGAQTVTLYQVGDMVEGASFNNFLDALDEAYCTFEGGDDPLNDAPYPDPYGGGGYPGKDCGTISKPAHVISTSYAYNEADLSPAYTARQCVEYAKLGLMGVTVLYSSGDNGVAGSPSDGGNRFNPSFPATCPYVTSVGATQVNPGAKIDDPESACETVIISGGGFSNYFAVPDYQAEAVGHWLSHHKPSYPENMWNSTGQSRAFPDLSANGANYVVAVDGTFSLVFGTSASSPVVGALLTLVNDARLHHGKSPIGFINPAIYSHHFRHAFNDITTGGNPGCGTSGFEAAKGWDPVTGLGTPNFKRLMHKFLELP